MFARIPISLGSDNTIFEELMKNNKHLFDMPYDGKTTDLKYLLDSLKSLENRKNRKNGKNMKNMKNMKKIGDFELINHMDIKKVYFYKISDNDDENEINANIMKLSKIIRSFTNNFKFVIVYDPTNNSQDRKIKILAALTKQKKKFYLSSHILLGSDDEKIISLTNLINNEVPVMVTLKAFSLFKNLYKSKDNCKIIKPAILLCGDAYNFDKHNMEVLLTLKNKIIDSISGREINEISENEDDENILLDSPDIFISTGAIFHEKNYVNLNAIFDTLGHENVKGYQISVDHNIENVCSFDQNGRKIINERLDVKETLSGIVNKLDKMRDKYNVSFDNLIEYSEIHKEFAFKLMKQYEKISKRQYDMVFVYASDCVIENIISNEQIMDVINHNTILMDSNILMVCKRKYLDFYNNYTTKYGDYYFYNNRREFAFNGYCSSKGYYTLEEKGWTFAPEVQFSEHMLTFLENKNVSVKMANLSRMCKSRFDVI